MARNLVRATCVAAGCIAALHAGATRAVALSAAEQAQLREAHALEKAYTAEANRKRNDAQRLASRLGRENNRDAIAFLLELGDWTMLLAFSELYNAPTTPEIEALVVKHLYDPAWRPCAAAMLVRGYQLRELYAALLEKSRAMPDGYPICVKAMVQTELPGIEPDLAALLLRLDDYYARLNVATFLVHRKYVAAEPELVGWLQASPDNAAGSNAWVVAKLDTPGVLDAMVRRLAKLRRAAPGPEIESSLTSLVAAIEYATPQVRMDRDLLSAEVLDGFVPAYREKVQAMMKRRGELEAMAFAPNPENLAWWIAQGKNERVRAFLAAGVDLNTLARSGDTPLHVAVKYSNWEAMDLLLQAGANPNASDWTGDTVLKVLAGRKPVVVTQEAPMAAAATRLVAKGADPSLASKDTWTPLHRAAAGDFLSMVRALVEGGANVNAEAREQGIDGLRPLQIAEDQGYAAVGAFLKSKGAKTSPAFTVKRAAQRALIEAIAPFLHMH